MESKQEAPATPIVAFFAHKGGVSKTTNCSHLGWMLAQHKGQTVILVDADPQCNLTQTLCPESKSIDNWRADVARGTLYSAIRDYHHGTKKEGLEPEPADCIAIGQEFMAANGGALWLVPGSLDLATLEPQLTLAHNITNVDSFPLFRDLAGAFRALLHSTCARYGATLMLIDMGPSIGELNKNLFWSSDYFVIPATPDAYCKTTMITMEKTLPKWCDQQKRIWQATAEMAFPLAEDPPQFLGLVLSLFNVNGKNKKVVKDSKHWMDIVQQQVVNKLVPALAECDMINEPSTKLLNQFTFAEIPHFLSLNPLAQRLGVPVFVITELEDDEMTNVDEDGEEVTMSKTERNRHKERSRYFFDKYSDAADVLLQLLQ